MKVVDWLQALELGSFDETVGIRITKLCGDEQFSTFLTSIDPGKYVNPHYHRLGNQHYHIIAGTGEIWLVDVNSGTSTTTTVCKNNSFMVDANKIHSLKNTGPVPLVLMFSCPESHLTHDRHLD